MGKESAIEWCDSTLNLMMGCDGCELASRGGSGTCYAETLTDRYGGSSKGYPTSFYEPALFPGRLAEAARWPDLTGIERPDKPHLNGLPRHIFHGDMGDYWTESLPLDWLAPHVERIAAIPALHLFLTKRPGRMARFWREHGPVPSNFLLMTSVTARANLSRISSLHCIDACSRGLSIEPLLEDLGTLDLSGISWVIVGGESGHGARPFDVAWARSIVAQCKAAGIPVFVKQLGSKPCLSESLHGWPAHVEFRQDLLATNVVRLKDKKGGDPSEWPGDLRVREMPEVAHA
jgi:protein gp37